MATAKSIPLMPEDNTCSAQAVPFGCLSFSVPFVKGKARPRFVAGRGGVHAYTPRETVEAEAEVRDTFKSVAAERMDAFPLPLRTPVMLMVVTRRPIPSSRPKAIHEEYDTFKPDGDNVLKLVCDALNGVAWADDSQVVVKRVEKMPRSRDVKSPLTQVGVLWLGDATDNL